MYLSIVSVENHRITKYAKFDTEPAAQAHCAAFGGFVYTGAYSPDLYVDGETVTVQPKAETAEQTIKRLEKVLDAHLDSVANSYRYESIRTMVTYATSDHATFGPEGRAAVAFRDVVYSYGIAKIEACTREVDPEPIPTEAQMIADCPVFEDYLQA